MRSREASSRRPSSGAGSSSSTRVHPSGPSTTGTPSTPSSGPPATVASPRSATCPATTVSRPSSRVSRRPTVALAVPFAVFAPLVCVIQGRATTRRSGGHEPIRSKAAPGSSAATCVSSSCARATSSVNVSSVRPRRRPASAARRSSTSSPLIRTVDHSGTRSSPCWPPTNPPMRWRRRPSDTASSRRNRSVSSQAPMPITRCRPSALAITATPSSTGLDTTITTSCPDPCSASARAYASNTGRLSAASWVRGIVTPGRAGVVRPAARTMTSATTSSGWSATSSRGACSS